MKPRNGLPTSASRANPDIRTSAGLAYLIRPPWMIAIGSAAASITARKRLSRRLRAASLVSASVTSRTIPRTVSSRPETRAVLSSRCLTCPSPVSTRIRKRVGGFSPRSAASRLARRASRSPGWTSPRKSKARAGRSAAPNSRQALKGRVDITEFSPGDNVNTVRNLLDDGTVDASIGHAGSSLTGSITELAAQLGRAIEQHVFPFLGNRLLGGRGVCKLFFEIFLRRIVFRPN